MNYLQLNKEYTGNLNIVEKKKHLLKIRMVGLLYLHGRKTNAQICKGLSISSPTSISLLNELIAEGIVEKAGRGKSNGGRKPDLFRLKDNCIFILAISIGKFKTEMAIFNNNNEMVGEPAVTPLHLNDDIEILDRLHQNAEELIERSGINPKQLLGVGVSMPGLVDSNVGRNYTYLRGGDVSLQQALEAKFQRPVFIENDAKAGTMAEYRFGIARNKKNVLAIFLGWGIGLGIIQDGKLYTGSTGFAGELGHIPITDNGQLCACGKQGCLETLASGSALVKMAVEGIKQKKSAMLSDCPDKNMDNLDPGIIVEAALRGDQYAINIIGEAGLNLGKAISILIQLFNPELIILSGKIAEAKQYLTIPVKQAVNIHCMSQLSEKTTIQISDLGRRAGLLGSVAIVMEKIFEER